MTTFLNYQILIYFFSIFFMRKTITLLTILFVVISMTIPPIYIVNNKHDKTTTLSTRDDGTLEPGYTWVYVNDSYIYIDGCGYYNKSEIYEEYYEDVWDVVVERIPDMSFDGCHEFISGWHDEVVSARFVGREKYRRLKIHCGTERRIKNDTWTVSDIISFYDPQYLYFMSPLYAVNLGIYQIKIRWSSGDTTIIDSSEINYATDYTYIATPTQDADKFKPQITVFIKQPYYKDANVVSMIFERNGTYYRATVKRHIIGFEFGIDVRPRYTKSSVWGDYDKILSRDTPTIELYLRAWSNRIANLTIGGGSIVDIDENIAKSYIASPGEYITESVNPEIMVSTGDFTIYGLTNETYNVVEPFSKWNATLDEVLSLYRDVIVKTPPITLQGSAVDIFGQATPYIQHSNVILKGELYVYTYDVVDLSNDTWNPNPHLRIIATVNNPIANPMVQIFGIIMMFVGIIIIIVSTIVFAFTRKIFVLIAGTIIGTTVIGMSGIIPIPATSGLILLILSIGLFSRKTKYSIIAGTIITIIATVLIIMGVVI